MSEPLTKVILKEAQSNIVSSVRNAVSYFEKGVTLLKTRDNDWILKLVMDFQDKLLERNDDYPLALKMMRVFRKKTKSS